MEIARIEQQIYEIRGVKVMLDFDLAKLYKTETRALKQAVRRNKVKFPRHFMFVLKRKEWEQVITKCDKLPAKVKFSPALPYAFTEHGVLMLANVLRSRRATAMSVRIIEVFIRMRQMLFTHKDILLQLEKIEARLTHHDEHLKILFQHLKRLLGPPQQPRR